MRCSNHHPFLFPYFSYIQAEQSAPFFSKIVPSKFSLELVIYYTCLQLYATTASLEEPMTNPHPYLHPPVQLVEHVTSHVTSSDVCHSHSHVALLRKYKEFLDDYTQGEVLLGLGLGEPFLTCIMHLFEYFFSWFCFLTEYTNFLVYCRY